MKASSAGCEECVNKLLNCGADHSLVNKQGHSALMMAVLRSNDKVIQQMVAAGVDVNEAMSGVFNFLVLTIAFYQLPHIGLYTSSYCLF
jgi:ankyrin repeat protein